MRKVLGGLLLALIASVLAPSYAHADGGVCPRPKAGSEIQPPADLYSQGGVLNVTFYYYTSVDDAGRTLFCFDTPDGTQSPTLHVNPGDTLTIALTNKIQTPRGGPSEVMANKSNVCGDATMDITSVNVHFHGTNTSPKCGSDEVIHTLINAGESFNYTLKFPKDEPPGLYWYHPHVHGISSVAVEGGATGLIEVEGIANVQPIVAGLPERYLVIRDQPVIVKPGFGKLTQTVPSWDISLNYVPISFPHYKPSIIRMTNGQNEFWRVANTSANTIIDLKLNYDGVAQPMQIVALDGVPIGSQDGKGQGTTITQTDILLPPAARAEFLVVPPSKNVKRAALITLPIGGGSSDDITTLRPLASIQLTNAPVHLPRLPERSGPPNPQRFAGLKDAAVTAKRKLYFSEYIIDGQQTPPHAPPSGPRPPDKGDQTFFYITVDGQREQLYDPNEKPKITTNQGAVEEWTIENRTLEVHEFHIHQIHFLVEAVNGVEIPKDQQQYYDTFQVPFWDGVSGTYPSIKVKLDFRGAVIGDFVYHCHILEHEDAGMMATIRVLPKGKGDTRQGGNPHGVSTAGQKQPGSLKAAGVVRNIVRHS